MNMRQLEIFHAVMREGSISDAARALRISQPAVTKSLRLTEQALGIVLFRRVGGRLYPSAAAETLSSEVARVGDEFTAVLQLAERLKDGKAGRLEIASLPSLCEWVVPSAIVALQKERPDVQIEVAALPSAIVVERVASRRADLGLVYDPSENPYVETQDVYAAEAVCVLPRRHPLANRSVVTLEDIAAYRLIAFRADTGMGAALRRGLRAAGIKKEPAIISNSSNLSLRLVSEGAGIAVIDPFALASRSVAGLVALPLRPAIPVRAKIIRARERPPSPLGMAFARALKRAISAARPLLGSGARQARHATNGS